MKLQDIYPSSQSYEKAKFRMKTITPVHIGGRTSVGSNRILITQGVRAIIDEEKLFNQFYSITQEGVIDDYLNGVYNAQSSLFGFLNRHNWFTRYPNNATIDAFARGVAAYQLDWYRGIPSGRPSSIRPFIRDGEQKAYIPGTSIKGAIRTAILYGQLDRLKQESRDDFEQIVQNIRERLPEVKSSSTNPAIEIGLIEDVLQDFDAFVDDDNWFTPKEESLRDFLKAFLISDTEPVTGNLNLCRVQWVSEGEARGWHFSESEDRHGNKFPTAVYVEVLPEGITLECDGAVDKFTVSRFRERTQIAKSCFSDINSILNHLECFAKDLLAFEKGFFQHLYNQVNDPLIKVALDEYDRIIGEKPNLRIGWGTGVMSITILRLMLDQLDQPDNLVETIRDKFFPNLDKYGLGIEYFPKTRRFIVKESGNQGSYEEEWELITPLGWCRLEQEGGSE